jgi:hypothetical protein
VSGCSCMALYAGGEITFGPLRYLVRRVLVGSGVGHDGCGEAVSGWWRCVCFVCMLLSRSWAGAQADCKDELRGKEAIEHVKGLLALLAGGVDAGTQGRELRRCNEELADRLAK